MTPHLPAGGADRPPLPQPLAAVVTGLNAVAAACIFVAGLMLVVLVAIFGWLVFGRYILNDTPTWVEQASLMLVVWITFLGAAVGIWRGTHLSIDFIREGLPAVPRQVLRIVTDVALIGFGAVTAWYGAELAERTASRMVPMLGVSESWRSIPIALFGALVAVFALTHLVVHLLGRSLDEH